MCSFGTSPKLGDGSVLRGSVGSVVEAAATAARGVSGATEAGYTSYQRRVRPLERAAPPA